MSDQAQPRILPNIDVPKTLAGTLAAVSAAVVGSYLGVAGTIIGAAVASLISSVGTEVYHRYLDHGTKKLQSAFVTAPAAVGTPEVAAAPEPPSQPEPPRQIRWKRVGVVAGALFVLGLGTLTAVELVTGQSAGQATGGGSGSNPTLVQLSGNKGDTTQDKKEEKKEQEPGTAATTEPAGEATEPAAEETTAPAPEQTEAETAEPTDAPAPAAPADETGQADTGTETTTEGE
ncbi:hypothetical protein ACQP2E_31090 [Actinoplanes sp. CA-015351]|uniref:hypothetical protein n=1 Tax=Actinoplanes sp. CA-015351 TaxID=3239897 RepID=UPI003D979F1F